MEREIRAIDRTEQKLILDIKKTAKTGNKRSVETLAKQLVQLRKQREKLMVMKSHITAVGFQATAMAGQAAMAGIMGNVAGAAVVLLLRMWSLLV